MPCISYSSREEAGGSLVTFVVWHWDRNVTLAKGSESPLLSAAMRPRAWYMCALNWKTCWAVENRERENINRLLGVVCVDVCLQEAGDCTATERHSDRSPALLHDQVERDWSRVP